MTIVEGPLVWPVSPDVGTMPPGLDSGLVDLAEQAAVEWLYAISGRQFGTYSAAWRPETSRGCVAPGDYPSYLQSIYGPLGWPFSGDPRQNDLIMRSVIELPGPVDAAPVTAEIYDLAGVHTSLTTEGATPQIRLEGNWLVRQDGLYLPDTQNMIAALGSPNTWAITYTRGVEVPVLGQVAAALLAVEFGKRFVGDTKCKIPYNAVTVSRGGVTINRNVLKATTTTGVAEADQWIASVNPNDLQSAPQVWSPDTARNGSPFAGSYVVPAP